MRSVQRAELPVQQHDIVSAETHSPNSIRQGPWVNLIVLESKADNQIGGNNLLSIAHVKTTTCFIKHVLLRNSSCIKVY